MNKSASGLKQMFKENKGFILLIVLMSVCRSALADWYTVPTGSMLPTIEVGDRVTVNKMAYDLRVPFTSISIAQTGEPERGDIVVFESDAADERLIKRVVGLPGDTVEMQNEVLIINGQPLQYVVQSDDVEQMYAQESLGNDSHVIRLAKQNGSGLDNFAPVVVPAGQYLVLGDNRRNSADSRVYGFVPRSELRGKAQHVAFSLDFDNNYMPRSERFLSSLYEL